ncbi:MAG: phosphate/phosphite/phosphonate ABC transporter substrate-binding protein [Pseudomonadota bacterium]
MRAYIKLLLTALLTLAAISMARAGSDAGELVLGIYPFLSSSQIADRYSPLRDHLAQQLNRPVSLRSAPDFDAFIERTRRGEYDIIFTAPHMGRLAEQRDGYRALAQTGYSIIIVALARKDGPINKITDLKGRSLAVGARLSMSYQMVERELERHDLSIGRDVRFVDTANFSNVLESLVRKEADAGATGTLLWDNAPPEKHRVLREIWRSQTVPGFLLLAHPRLGNADLKRLKQALFDFSGTPAGKAYFEKTQQIDFRPIDAATLKRIDPYTTVFGKP